MSLADNVKFLRERLGMTQAELGEKLGKGQTTIQKIEAGETLRPRFMNKMAEILGVDVYTLEYGDATQPSPSTTPLTPRRESNVRDFGKFRLWSKNDPLPEDEYVHLPFYKEIRMKGGSGSFEMEDYNGYTLPFAKATLYRYNVDTEHSFCCTLDGDSMEPVIPDGATIGISVGDDHIKDGKIYAFEHDGLFRVKRLYLMPGGQVRINSFNQDDPAYADEFAPLEEIRIVGRVFTWSVMV